MKKILSLCINLSLLIISEAGHLKLIAGDRSVVKKDGATHTISKYYLVPNDFNPSNVTNNTEKSHTMLHINRGHSESMDSDSATEIQTSEKRSETANYHINENVATNNNEVTIHSNFSDVKVDVVRADDNTTKSTESINTERYLDFNQSSNLQVKPIDIVANVNSKISNEFNEHASNETVQNRTLTTTENITQTSGTDDLDDLILTKFGNAMHESCVQNQESFWKLIKLNIDDVSITDDKVLKKMEKLSLLLNILTYLYEAAQSQKPVESMVDNIINILEIPFVEVKKSNTSESPSQSYNAFRSGIDSTASDNLELLNLDLQRQHQQTTLNPAAIDTNQPSSTTNLPWPIEKRIDYLKILNQYRTGTLHSAKDRSEKRNQIYTYVLNPATSLYEIALTSLPISQDQENDVLQVSKGSHTGVLLPNVPSTLFESLINLDNTQPASLTNAETSDFHIGDTESSPYNFNIILNHIQKKNLHPNLPGDYSEYVYGGQTHKPSTLITSSSSSSSAHPNLPDEYSEYVYNGQIHQPSTLITPSSTSSSAHPNLPDDYSEYVYNGQIHQPSTLITPSSSSSSAHPNLPDDYSEYVYGGQTHKPSTLFTSSSSSSSAHPNLPDDYSEYVYGRQRHQPSTLIFSSSSSSSAHPNLPDDYSEYVYGGQKHKPSTFFTSSSSSSSAHPNLPDDYSEYVYGGQTHKPSILFTSSSSSSSAHPNLPDDYSEYVYGGQKHKPSTLFNPSPSSSSVNPNLPDDYSEYVYGGQRHQPSTLITLSPSSSSVHPNLSDDYSESLYDGQSHQPSKLISLSSSSSLAHPNLSNDYSEYVYGGQKHKPSTLFTSSSSSSSAHPNLPDDYSEYVYDGQKHKPLTLFNPSPSSSSVHPNLPDDYSEYVYGGQTHQPSKLISLSSSSSSAHPNLSNDYSEYVYGGQTHQPSTLITSLPLSHSASPNLPDDYSEYDYGGHIHQPSTLITSSSSSSSAHPSNKPFFVAPTHQHPGLLSSSFDFIDGQTKKYPGFITKASTDSKYTNGVNDYVEPIPLYGEQIQTHPDFISKAPSHSESPNLPNEYINPMSDQEEDPDRYPLHMKSPVNGIPMKNRNKLPVSYQLKIVQPSQIVHLQPTELNYLKHWNLKLAPTYQLFTLNHLLKLYDAVIKTIEVNRNKADVYDSKGLMNLKKIIHIILILATHLEDPEGNSEWYENILYNTQREYQHPLENYVYYLIRQKWLHELMLVLQNNNFNINILQNPRIFSFLGSWKFPKSVLKFLETEELIKHHVVPIKLYDQTFNSPYNLQDNFATHTYDDFLKELPINIKNDLTYVIKSYKRPNAGIDVSIAGVKAEPHTNAIIDIIQKYLPHKSFIEKQDDVVIHNNKIEMLNRIILFLRQKGYDTNTIADLIRKLITTVYSIPGKECQPVLPILSSSKG